MVVTQAVRRSIKVVNSYPHAAADLAHDCVRRLKTQMKPSKRFEYETWIDLDIEPGRDWHATIQAKIAGRDLALMFVCPEFFGSNYIRTIELPPILAEENKPFIPVLIKPVSFELYDMGGLEHYQFFGLHGRRGKLRSYGECRDSYSRDEFARQLFIRMEGRLA